MSIWLVAAAAAGSFVEYPAFVNPKARVEAVMDRGPIAELVIKCPRGMAIMSYSKVERLYCTPKRRCTASLERAIADSCR